MHNSQLLEQLEKNTKLKQISNLFSQVEQLLTARNSPFKLTSKESTSGAKSAYDNWLRTVLSEELIKIFPDSHIFWDDQLDLNKDKEPFVLVDLVDGSKEYLRNGANVSSHIGVFSSNNISAENLEFAVISMPFHKYRLVYVKDVGVFYVNAGSANTFETNAAHADLVNTPQQNADLSEIQLFDRLSDFTADSQFRMKLDRLRKEVSQGKGSYSFPRGSVAKSILEPVINIEPSIVILKHDAQSVQKIPFHDYAVCAEVLEKAGGVFYKLEGSKPDLSESLDGFIAASNPFIYKKFIEYING